MFKRKKKIINYLGCSIVVWPEMFPFVRSFRVLSSDGVYLGTKYSLRAARRLILDFYAYEF